MHDYKKIENTTINGRVLVLNNSYEPVTVCTARKALILLILTKAEVIAKKEGRFVHSISRVFPLPSVIRLSSYIRVPYKRIELSRKNILRRDDYRCQYCGSKSPDLTIDHIIPKSRGGSDTWENLVSACKKCNNRKGSRTPEEAGMRLLHKPNKPHHILFIQQFMGKMDDKWKPFLFLD